MGNGLGDPSGWRELAGGEENNQEPRRDLNGGRAPEYSNARAGQELSSRLVLTRDAINDGGAFS